MATRRFCTYCGDLVVYRVNGPAGRWAEGYHATPGKADPKVRPDTATVNEIKRKMRRSVFAGIRDLQDA